jgi:Ras GTPase-activating-like protein IQGAP2/3
MINQIETETGETCPLPRSISFEEAEANADVQAIIQPRVAILISIANSFLDTVINCLDEVPYGIRWICKQIKQLTKVISRRSCKKKINLILEKVSRCQ